MHSRVSYDLQSHHVCFRICASNAPRMPPDIKQCILLRARCRAPAHGLGPGLDCAPGPGLWLRALDLPPGLGLGAGLGPGRLRRVRPRAPGPGCKPQYRIRAWTVGLARAAGLCTELGPWRGARARDLGPGAVSGVGGLVGRNGRTGCVSRMSEQIL